MASTLALQFLSLVLLFLMNGHGIGARDMKVELRDQKQVEWYKASPVSNDESYGRGAHVTTNNQPNYIAGYKTNTHDSNEPYITQYGETSPKNDPKESSNADHTEAFKTGFFALDDLHIGNVMTLQFPIQEVSHFLPRKEAEAIPFSISQLPSVLQLFSIPEDSPEANAMRGTLGQCEGEPITGETKICATSLESMLEFVDTIIGSEAKRNILTTSYPTASSVPLQKYTILEISEDINAPKWVACHPLPYPFAIYYCHFIATGSKVFKVTLGGENGGNKIEALGICHLDTSDWSPDHILFRQLGIKPGKAPVCHFFPIKHLMWVPQPSQATM
ncbi:RAFTIN 1A [Spatholobus suberectus]|nr:RAFTIN 1A [Spatholobus suberectus]